MCSYCIMPEIYKGTNNSVRCTYIFFCFVIKVQILKKKKKKDKIYKSSLYNRSRRTIIYRFKIIVIRPRKGITCVSANILLKK